MTRPGTSGASRLPNDLIEGLSAPNPSMTGETSTKRKESRSYSLSQAATKWNPINVFRNTGPTDRRPSIGVAQRAYKKRKSLALDKGNTTNDVVPAQSPKQGPMTIFGGILAIKKLIKKRQNILVLRGDQKCFFMRVNGIIVNASGTASKALMTQRQSINFQRVKTFANRKIVRFHEQESPEKANPLAVRRRSSVGLAMKKYFSVDVEPVSPIKKRMSLDDQVEQLSFQTTMQSLDNTDSEKRNLWQDMEKSTGSKIRQRSNSLFELITGPSPFTEGTPSVSEVSRTPLSSDISSKELLYASSSVSSDQRSTADSATSSRSKPRTPSSLLKTNESEKATPSSSPESKIHWVEPTRTAKLSKTETCQPSCSHEKSPILGWTKRAYYSPTYSSPSPIRRPEQQGTDQSAFSIQTTMSPLQREPPRDLQVNTRVQSGAQISTSSNCVAKDGSTSPELRDRQQQRKRKFVDGWENTQLHPMAQIQEKKDAMRQKSPVAGRTSSNWHKVVCNSSSIGHNGAAAAAATSTRRPQTQSTQSSGRVLHQNTSGGRRTSLVDDGAPNRKISERPVKILDVTSLLSLDQGQEVQTTDEEVEEAFYSITSLAELTDEEWAKLKEWKRLKKKNINYHANGNTCQNQSSSTSARAKGAENNAMNQQEVIRLLHYELWKAKLEIKLLSRVNNSLKKQRVGHPSPNVQQPRQTSVISTVSPNFASKLLSYFYYIPAIATGIVTGKFFF